MLLRMLGTGNDKFQNPLFTIYYSVAVSTNALPVCETQSENMLYCKNSRHVDGDFFHKRSFSALASTFAISGRCYRTPMNCVVLANCQHILECLQS